MLLFNMNKKDLLVVLLFCMLPFCAIAQRGLLGKTFKVSGTPPKGDITLSQEPAYRGTWQFVDGYPENTESWIVYSDRANNFTSQTPQSDARYKSLGFMQACYVVESKGDFLRLAAYKPGQNLRRGNKMSIEAAEELGWIHKNNLLLWSNSIHEKGTNYNVKAITAFGGERVFTSLPGHVSGDSIITFANPMLNEPLGKTAMGQIFYIYKPSASGNEYLAGPEPGFLPDSSASSGLCWISKDLLRVWGARAFLRLNDEFAKNEPGGLFFFEANPLSQNSFKTPAFTYHFDDPALKTPLEKLLPLWEIHNDNAQKTYIRTAVLTDVMDRQQNEVRNVLGSVITYEKYRKMISDNANLNIVFVVDGGARNAQYINQLLNIIQSPDWQKLANSKFRQVKFGGVFYKDQVKNCSNVLFPLNSEVKNLRAFFEAEQKDTNPCDDNKASQSVFAGLTDAGMLLSKNQDDNNIVVLFGGDGDVSNNARLGQVISNLSYVNAKLLVFQTYSIGNAINNNFVIQGRQIIQKTADNIVEMKKSRMVEYSSSPLNASEFAPLEAETNIQMLDFPTKSMTQGIIVFPKRGEIMAPGLLETSLSRLIKQISDDNIALEKSLSHAFATQGSRGTTINHSFAWLFPQASKSSLPEEYLRSNTLRKQDFLVPAWITIGADDFEVNRKTLKSGLLLNYGEYQRITSQMENLTSAADTRKAIYKHFQNLIKKYNGKSAWGTNKKESLTFSQLMALVTGFYPMDSVWMNTKISAFRSDKNIPLEIATSFLEEARKQHVWLLDNINNPNIRLKNNGNTYYILTHEHLPAFTSLNESVIQTFTKTEVSGVDEETKKGKKRVKEESEKVERRARSKAKQEAAEKIETPELKPKID